MKKELIAFIGTMAVSAVFGTAPFAADEIVAERNELNYTKSFSEKVEVASPFDQLMKFTSEKEEETEESIVDIARAYEGTPYAFGGTSPRAFDYSGFVFYVYEEAGKELPRTAAAQYAAVEKISQSEAEPGDLIFFNQTGGVDHVGIYLGEEEFISAKSEKGVTISSFDTGYWSNNIVGFGRVN